MSKYRFTGDTLVENGVTLHGIVALKDFGEIKKDQPGGWIEKESNLSQADNCWVTAYAMIIGGATVRDNAVVRNFATVKDSAIVEGLAVVEHAAKVAGNAHIGGDVHIRGRASIKADAIITRAEDYIWIPEYNITAYRTSSGVLVVLNDEILSVEEFARKETKIAKSVINYFR